MDTEYFHAATMPQARLRWHGHTKRVCKPDVLAAAKEKTEWQEPTNAFGVAESYLPTLILGHDARYRFVFERTPNGATFARQIFAPGCVTLADKLQARARL